jgi:hypothetical protein
LRSRKVGTRDERQNWNYLKVPGYLVTSVDHPELYRLTCHLEQDNRGQNNEIYKNDEKPCAPSKGWLKLGITANKKSEKATPYVL